MRDGDFNMITYLYWALVIGLVITAGLVVGIKLNNYSLAILSAIVILATGWIAYHFHFQQLAALQGCVAQ